MATKPVADLCPACGYREADDLDSGFCTQCRQDKTLQTYRDKQEEDAQSRKNVWIKQTAVSREWDAERQRVHRFIRHLRPREPVPDTDPWRIALEALRLVDVVRRPNTVMSRLDHAGAAEELKEHITWLAYGPSSEGSRPANPAPSFDVTSPGGRGRKGMHTRWHLSGLKPCNCGPRP